MENLRCVVVDDEPLAAGLIAGYIEKTPNMTLAGVFGSAQEAVRTIMQGGVDLVFLDIEMPQLNGVEFAHIMPQSTRVVFTTAYDSYAVRAFRMNALDYLLKPISYEEFMGAALKGFEWKRLVKKADEAHLDYIIVKSDYKMVQIPVDDIVYVEGLKDYIKIFTEGGEKCTMTLMSMKNMELTLPASKFMRIHRSFIVNKSKVTVIERNRVLFGKVAISVSDTYRNVFNEFLNERLINLPRNMQDDDPEE